MSQASKAIALLLLIPALLAAPLIAQSAGQQPDERLFDALVNARLGDVYYEDGAADGTVLMAGESIGSGPYMHPHPAVKALVDLRERALPLLIRHLDDKRPTGTTFKERPVPAGHVALDVLLGIVKRDARFFIPDCADDGLGACVKPGYYFRPDASAMQMAEVKANWEKAYRANHLRFVYPHFWK
jgi:hypothetical protein